ncbi:hypothetical protein GYMLUDRAFT_241433 [Collybiopsis luxurians FD-317 M1]|uniref:Unplaced genomic scaffold GYMLUscaffold_14, whole genome shotgun sequence n=1 Tax=Collybiopsis luxurians FD-317 M1 TaxID=944289 RepID=A0A0D0CWK1_9AGAR|nr:hypothetical protein GYMLUDRAFT_241433 [Collybiopsis luxurians FD-317 M1]
MSVGQRPPRSFYFLGSAVILSTFILFVFSSEFYGFEERVESCAHFRDPSPLWKQQHVNSVSKKLDMEPEPGFCNYCTPTDEICKRYGSFNLARSRAYEGPNAQLKRVLRKARSKQPIKIGILGGSVSMGLGVTPATNWATLYAEYIRDTYGVEVELINGSVGATTSEYMETCLLEHIPEDVDLVFIELAINDRRFESLAVAYENLIRAVWELPNRPAIINVQIMALMFNSITMGGDLHTAVAQYYDTPIVSVRNVLLPQILQTTQVNSSDTSLEDYWYHHTREGIDLRHLGTNGHRMIADLLKSFTSRVACEGWREEHAARIRDPSAVGSWDWIPGPNEGLLPNQDVEEYLPRQSLFQKFDHSTVMRPAKPFCQTAEGTKHPLKPLPAPLSTEGEDAFQPWWHPTRPDKVWLTGRKPGVKVAFKVEASTLGRIRLTYLRSKTYGLGSAVCWLDDNRAGGTQMNGWWDVDHIHSPHTVTLAENVEHGEHILHCEILKETKDPGGGTEFRIIAIDAL